MARPPGRVGIFGQAGRVTCGWLLALCAVQSWAADLPLDKASEPVREAWQQCFLDHPAAQACIDDLYARASEFLPSNDSAENPSATSLNWGEYQYLLALLQRAVQQQDPMGDTVGALLGWKRHAENATYAFQEEGESLAALWAMVLYIEGQLAFLYGPEGDQTREQSVQAYLQLQDSVQDQAPALLEYFAVILARAHPQIDPSGQGKPPQSRDYYQQAEAYAVAGEAWERVVDYRLMLNAMDSSEDRQDAIADFALEKGLRTQAVAVLLQGSRITEMGVQNFDSPEIQRAQQRLTRACELARSDLEHFLCAFYRGQMAVRLGDLQTASQLAMALDEQAQVLADPAWLQYLNVNELAATLSRIAYESGNNADAASLMRQLVETLLGIGQPVSALGNEIYNLALFTLRAGEDPMALDVVQNYLQQERVTKGNRDDFYHLAAAYAWQSGDLETAVEKLEMISADRYLSLSGYYQARIMMLKALQGDSNNFFTALQDGDFYSMRYALRESAIALLEVREDDALTLSVKGDMFPLFPRGGWFVSFAQAATASATHLVALAGGESPEAVPELVVDSGSAERSTKALSLTSDGKTAVICSGSKICSVRESDTGRLLRSWRVGEMGQAFLADDNVLVTNYAVGNGTVKLWSVDSGDMLASYGVPSSVGNSVYEVPGDRYLVMVNEKIDVLDYRAGKIEKTLSKEVFHRYVAGPDNQLVHIAPGRHGGEVLVSLTSGDPAGHYNLMDWQDVVSHFVWWSVADNTLSQAAPDRAGHWAAELSPSGSLRLRQRQRLFDESAPLLVNNGNEPRACDLACQLQQDFPALAKQNAERLAGFRQVSAAAGGRLLAEDSQGTSLVLDTVTGELLSEHRQGAHRPEQTVVSDDGEFIISLLPESDQVSIWSVPRGREIRRLNDNYARGLLWIDDRLWAWQGDAVMWLPMSAGAEWTSLDLESNEESRFPEIEQLIAVPGESTLRILERVYLREEERHRFQVRELQRDGSAVQTLSWHFVDRERAHGYSPPVILPGAEQVAYFSDESTLQVASLSDGTVEYSVALKENGGDLLPLGEQVLALIDYDRLQIHNLATGEQWSSAPLLGEYRSATLDPAGEQVWVTEDLGRRSRLLRFALADGTLLADQLYQRSLQSMRPVAAGKWWLGEESDGALSVWPTSARAPLFRFWSLLGKEWLVVDDEGRYDSSAPGDLDALSWVLSDRPREALPLQAFMKDFYQPGLMQRHLAGERFPAMASVASLQRTLPDIVLASVEQRRDGRATVAVTVDPQGAGEVADLRLFRNGQLVGYLPEKGNGVFHDSRRKKTYRFDVALPAEDAPVAFSAYAFNKDGVRSERAVSVLDDFDPQPASPRRAFVITLGVNRYQNPAFNLRYAANDARAYSRSLTASLDSTGNFDDIVHISLISEQGSEGMAATRDNLAAVLAALSGKGEHTAVPEPADTNDSIIVTFSGHGYADSGGQFHFLLEDIGEGNGRQVTDALLSRTFTSSDLEHYLRDVDAQGMFLVIDACNSAASIADGNFKPGPMGSKGLGQLAYDKAMMVITATQTEDVAMESQALEHGMLTYALVNEGLERGRADQLPADQTLWMRELFEYGQNRVPSLYKEVIEQGGPKNGSGDRGLSSVKSSSQRQRWLQQPSLFDFSRERDLLLDDAVMKE